MYLRFNSGLHRVLAIVVGLVCIAALVLLVIGDHFHNLRTLYTIANLAVMPLNLWAIILGVALYREHSSLSPLAQTE